LILLVLAIFTIAITTTLVTIIIEVAITNADFLLINSLRSKP
jgi:hypothetical protein